MKGVCLGIALAFILAGWTRALGIDSDAAYIGAVEDVIREYHIGYACSGSEWAEESLSLKAEGLLAIEEQAGPGVKGSLRECVAAAAFMDVTALEILDARTHPFSGKKISPVEGLPKLKVRLFKLATLKPTNPEKVMNNLLASRTMGWTMLGRFRGAMGPHETWERAAGLSGEKLERTDPSWAFLEGQATVPAASDAFGAVAEKADVIEGGVLDLRGRDAVKIEVRALAKRTSAKFRLQMDDDAHIDLNASSGVVSAYWAGRPAWAWAGDKAGRMPTRGTIKLPTSLQQSLVVRWQKIPRFDEVNVPANAVITIWKGDAEKMPSIGKADFVIGG